MAWGEWIAVAVLGLLASACASKDDVGALTGARTRIVWVQDVGTGRDVFAQGEQLILMGYDSADGRGERVILDERTNYLRPILTPDGERVIFSNREGRCFVVNWDGSGLRQLAEGVALDAWRDPQTGDDWVFAGTAWGEGKGMTFGEVSRFRLDDPDDSEVVWNRPHVVLDNFQVSGDGRHFATLFPWPHAGVGRFAEGAWERYDRGCWPSMAPDTSYRMWIFDSGHTSVSIYTADGVMNHRVTINQAAGIDGFEVYHPRWSNHVRYMAMTGPYKVPGGHNRIRGGGADVEIYVGRFDPELKEIEAWVQVTDNEHADFYPDVWIEAGWH